MASVEDLMETIEERFHALQEKEVEMEKAESTYRYAFLHGFASGCVRHIAFKARKIQYGACDWCHSKFQVSRLSSWRNEWQHLCPGCYYCIGSGAPITMQEKV